MRRFYVKQIAASGDKVKYSAVTLRDGVNIIHGPSNSGKSYVIGCINFMLGGDVPFSKEDTGYDTISMILESDDGFTLSAERKIVDGKTGDTGAGTVKVVSNVPGIDSNDYKISQYEYSDLLLKLMGIEKRPMIISKQNLDVNNLTFRTMAHFFYIDENYIFKKETAFDAPKHSKITASLTSLLYLVKGDDLHRLVPEESQEERDRKALHKAGVIIYLNRKIKELTERKGAIEESVAAESDIDISAKIDSILYEIERIEKEIVDASVESRKLLEQIYTISAKLEEARFLRDRYHALHSQYASDIKRLQFISDGDKKRKNLTRQVKCPFCDGNLPKDDKQRESYIGASSAELARITLQLQDLANAEKSTSADIASLDAELKMLNARNDNITRLITRQLRPRAAELRETVDAYKRILLTRQDIYAIERMSTELSVDVFDKEHEEDDTTPKFDAKAQFDKDAWKALSDRFGSMVKDCAYPNKPDAHIYIDTADAVVGGKHKKNEGKGYRAFLNTIMLFNLMKYLEEHGTYAPHLLILDSPILSLKEKKIKMTSKEAATPGMKTSLFRYIIENCGENQVIIAENEIPEDVDYSKANLIEFTLEEGTGRYGFLKSEYN
jgi:hypothetical protein